MGALLGGRLSYYPKLSTPFSALRWSLASLTSIKSSISSLPPLSSWQYFYYNEKSPTT
nr:MAG TPA: hypothetical protein [Caudoviricetes sp.]